MALRPDGVVGLTARLALNPGRAFCRPLGRLDALERFPVVADSLPRAGHGLGDRVLGGPLDVVQGVLVPGEPAVVRVAIPLRKRRQLLRVGFESLADLVGRLVDRVP